MENKHIHLLDEIVPPEELPSGIAHDIRNKETSLGDNPAIPVEYDPVFLKKIISKEWERAKDRLKEIGGIADIPENDPEGELSRLILQCQELERPYRNELEIICANHLALLFRIPRGSIEMSLHLVDQIDLDDESVIVDPVDGNNTLRFADYDDAIAIRDEVYKRRFLGMLSTGAGLSFSEQVGSYSDDIYDINPGLINLYEKILTLNTYLLLSKANLEITDRNTRQIGANVVRLGSREEIVRIEAQGKIFPVLYAETVRGFMELFASHGLPDDMDRARLIIGKSDFIKAEPWDMRIGPAVWRILYGRLDVDETEDIPYLFKEISLLKPQSFFRFMREVLIDTEKGRRWISAIRERAERSRDGDRLVQRMDVERQSGVISDDISPLEL